MACDGCDGSEVVLLARSLFQGLPLRPTRLPLKTRHRSWLNRTRKDQLELVLWFVEEDPTEGEMEEPRRALLPLGLQRLMEDRQ